MNFEPFQIRECVQVPIVNDDMLEPFETFFVTLEEPPRLHELIQLGLSVTEVTIADDDSECNVHAPMYVISWYQTIDIDHLMPLFSCLTVLLYEDIGMGYAASCSTCFS